MAFLLCGWLIDSKTGFYVRILAVIPARGGSKSIPDKNIIDLYGKPLIAWTIQQALDSGVVDYIHVSTDDVKVAEVAKSLGSNCDFLRPADIAGDTVGTKPTILHAIMELEKRGESFDAVAELQPTYCFRGSQIIKQCVAALESEFSEHVDSVITCLKVEDTSHPDYVLGVDSHGYVEFGARALDEFARQSLRPMYSCRGIVLLSRIDAYLHLKSFFAGRCKPVIVDDPVRGLDINNPLDLEIARAVAALHPEALS
jgi:CMP-N,N'-diacetyllegionaminic acid synthase